MQDNITSVRPYGAVRTAGDQRRHGGIALQPASQQAKVFEAAPVTSVRTSERRRRTALLWYSSKRCQVRLNQHGRRHRGGIIGRGAQPIRSAADAATTPRPPPALLPNAAIGANAGGGSCHIAQCAPLRQTWAVRPRIRG